ncbi:MAG: TetR/AcrR family transcriptional regulator [Lactobacillus sp.]
MDRRTKYTQQVIKETLFDLLKTKKLDKITVKEVCDRADINRSTFYRNYLDIYDLFEKIEQELTQEVFQSGDLFSDRYQLLEVIYQHQDFYREFFQAGLESQYVKQVMEKIEGDMIAILKEKGKYDPDTFQIEYQYNYYGVVGVIKNWLKEGCTRKPQELGNILFAIVDKQYK